MARAKQKKPWSSTKRPQARKSKTTKHIKPDPIVKIEPEPNTDTLPVLLELIGKTLNGVDRAMAENSLKYAVHFRSNDPRVRSHDTEMRELTRRLDRLVNPESLAGGPWSDAAINQHFRAPAGEVPAWSRPGTFLLWVGYIPVRCIWGGFADPASVFVAADPKQLWFTPSGAWEIGRYLEPAYKTVADLFRRHLEREMLRKDLTLQPLNAIGQESVVQELQAPWLAEALKRGPVDPVGLPPHLRNIQIPLFA